GSTQPGHRQLVQLRLLLTRVEPEAARLGRAHGGRPVREDRDCQLLLSALATRVPDVPVHLPGRRLARRGRELVRLRSSYQPRVIPPRGAGGAVPLFLTIPCIHNPTGPSDY